MSAQSLDKISFFVKCSMLKYPLMYKSRMSVLSFLFFTNGTEYYFNPTSGEVESTEGHDIMYSEKRAYNFDVGTSRVDDEDLPASVRLKREYEKLTQDFIIQNIDEMAQHNVSFLSEPNPKVDAMAFSSSGSVLGQIEKFLDNPGSGVLDDEWRRATIEVCNHYINQCSDIARHDPSYVSCSHVQNLLGICNRVVKKAMTEDEIKQKVKNCEAILAVLEKFKLD